MSAAKIPVEVEHFIYGHVDSIGFLEALLLLSSDVSKVWTAVSLTQELRQNPASVNQYVGKLEDLKVLVPASGSAPADAFTYDASLSPYAQVIHALEEAYRVQRHKVFELIYSPLKRARDFSDAFLLPTSSSKKEDNND